MALGQNHFSSPGKSASTLLPRSVPAPFDDVLDGARESIGVEWTGFGLAEQHGQWIDVLSCIVQPQTHALN